MFVYMCVYVCCVCERETEREREREREKKEMKSKLFDSDPTFCAVPINVGCHPLHVLIDMTLTNPGVHSSTTAAFPPDSELLSMAIYSTKPYQSGSNLDIRGGEGHNNPPVGFRTFS